MTTARKYADGDRFGAWTVLVAYPPGDNLRSLCRCDCGVVKHVARGSLDTAKSCRACWSKADRRMVNGQRFGSWTVVDAYPGGQDAFCRCDCGTEKMVMRGALMYGHTKKCLRCKLNGAQKLVGTVFGSHEILEVDGQQVVLRCTKCNRKSVACLAYVRSKRGNKKCRRCDIVANPLVIAETGVSRQGIHARIANGWTREEAATTPKGQMPPRLQTMRSWMKEQNGG